MLTVGSKIRLAGKTMVITKIHEPAKLGALKTVALFLGCGLAFFVGLVLGTIVVGMAIEISFALVLVRGWLYLCRKVKEADCYALERRKDVPRY